MIGREAIDDRPLDDDARATVAAALIACGVGSTIARAIESMPIAVESDPVELLRTISDALDESESARVELDANTLATIRGSLIAAALIIERERGR